MKQRLGLGQLVRRWWQPRQGKLGRRRLGQRKQLVLWQRPPERALVGLMPLGSASEGQLAQLAPMRLGLVPLALLEQTQRGQQMGQREQRSRQAWKLAQRCGW